MWAGCREPPPTNMLLPSQKIETFWRGENGVFPSCSSVVSVVSVTMSHVACVGRDFSWIVLDKKVNVVTEEGTEGTCWNSWSSTPLCCSQSCCFFYLSETKLCLLCFFSFSQDLILDHDGCDASRNQSKLAVQNANILWALTIYPSIKDISSASLSAHLYSCLRPPVSHHQSPLFKGAQCKRPLFNYDPSDTDKCPWHCHGPQWHSDQDLKWISAVI